VDEAVDKAKAAALIPQPWNYNPSCWGERVTIAVLAMIACGISAYMALFQLGLTDEVWDPVFGLQTAQVLDSALSHAMSRWFRIPDALLGAIAYGADVIFVLAGSTRRWQYRPWLIATFGIVVIPLGLASLILVAMQAFLVGAWCFLCLITALLSIALIVLAMDEVVSSTLYLKRVWEKSRRFDRVWHTFWGRPSPVAHQAAMDMTRVP